MLKIEQFRIIEIPLKDLNKDECMAGSGINRIGFLCKPNDLYIWL